MKANHRSTAGPAARSILRTIAIWLVTFSPLAALDARRPADSYTINGWFTEDGLPSNVIRSIIQTRDGYLWLATAQGIARFDGSRFTVFDGTTHPELKGGGFYAVLEGPDGAIWFGGDHGLFQWKNGRFNRFTTADGLAHDYVRELALTRDGAIVAGTRRGFSFMRAGRLTTPEGIWKKARGAHDRITGLSPGEELGHLRKNIEHIKDVMTTQHFPSTT